MKINSIVNVLCSAVFCPILLILLPVCLTGFGLPVSVMAADFEKDTLNTSMGDLTITFIGHGTVMLQVGDLTVHVDPWSKLADYRTLPPADLILVTHHHGDHLDLNAIEALYKRSKVISQMVSTVVVMPEKCAQTLLEKVAAENRLPNSLYADNGFVKNIMGITIEAVPAYNMVNKRPDGNFYHLRGEGNGYILTIGNRRIYIAGDTEDIPEMAEFADIYCAFLPMNLPYTMTPEMAARAAGTIKPKILYPYHFGETDTQKLVELLKEEKGIEVRLRKMK
ncbi:MAG: metal-dependent hydrolase [Candidatus Wallbacteria bacterium HGW-Wallbacteria-1]|jgi:L-ascorbate metabolism protein UlaG (beta-lactamase superfamily)|uniref:Metal-dependent hydrolase n=1 Tax=Candidatus Wallbacteria bacterium HGW-Wallbacteria-1 TaxID=2013854 RepID=A0A2N1PIK4_9BACT|nr:MAG: metal-dependent hydrolase [Candidatus Wallbacteria bacterium HGW-Wallbacteria-1]